MKDLKIKFLTTAQRTQSLHIELGREELFTDFSQWFVSFGSCFAQNIERVLDPYGVHFWFNRDICAHYSVASIRNTLEQVATGREHTEDEIYHFDDERGGIVPMKYFYKRRVHGENATEAAFKRMKQLDDECRSEIKNCDHMLITLGTSRIVRKKDNGMVVACATGMPKDKWDLEMTTVEESVEGLESILESVKTIRGGTLPNMFFTISPQRYWFGNDILGDVSPVVDNCLSKSILRVALDQFVKNHSSESVHYFPAFELVIDELRVFESLSHYDFLHIEQEFTPNYVVKRFLESYASDDILRQLTLVDQSKLLVHDLKKEVDENLPLDDSFFVGKVDSLIQCAREVVGDHTWSPKLVQHLHRLLSLQQRQGDHEDIEALYMTSFEDLIHKRVAVWGAAGDFRYKWLPVLRQLEGRTELSLLVDGAPEKWGQKVEGYVIEEPQKLKEADVDCIIVASYARKAIVEQIKTLRPDLPIKYS